MAYFIATFIIRGVLEIGCGTGVNLPYYPHTVKRLTLLEPDTNMRQKLQEKMEVNNKVNSEIVNASTEAIPVPDASYDFVVSTLVLCSVNNPDKALSEIHRALRLHGKLIFIEHVAAQHNPNCLKWQRRLGPL